MEPAALFEKQKEYFRSGATRPYAFRAAALRRLKAAVQSREQALETALYADLHKQPCEAYMCELGIVLDEIGYHLKHLKGWMREKRVRTPLAQFPAVSFLSPEPYGVVLIASPWNYPLQLCLEPLIGAISGGNCAVVKPSAQAPETSRALASLIAETFPEEYVAVAECSRAEAGALFDLPWDYIFYTGSTEAAKTILATAAKYLTPVSLELGGKSPVIVDETADVKLAARRIAFGKVLNAGQTCVAPDYLLLHERVKDAFVREYENALREFFPDGDTGDMVRIVSDRHFERVKALTEDPRAVLGGETEAETRFVAPTLLLGVQPDDPVMRQEIFGPILPVLTFTELNWCVDFIRSRPKPLALYLFTTSREAERLVLDGCAFGGGCVNDVIVHLATPYMGFGGVGASGMGQYHGRKSFDTFTHSRSILRKSNLLDLPMRYMPYTDKKLKMIRRFLK